MRIFRSKHVAAAAFAATLAVTGVACDDNGDNGEELEQEVEEGGEEIEEGVDEGVEELDEGVDE